MPVDEGQEPKEHGTYDPRDFRPKVAGDDSIPQEPDRLYDGEGNPLPSFDPRYAEDFEGLTFIGALTTDFDWLGHSFRIRTLGTDDFLAVAQIVKPYQGTLGEPRAYATAIAALSVMLVDGKDEMPIPVGDGKGEFAWAYQRFNYVKANWFPFVTDKVYSEFRALEGRVEAVIEAMEKASGPAGVTVGSNANSVGPTDEGSSPEGA